MLAGGVGNGVSLFLESPGISIEDRMFPSRALFDVDGLCGILSDMSSEERC